MKNNLKSIVESLLFVSGEALSISDLTKITEQAEEEVQAAMDGLVKEYTDSDRGLSIIKKGKSYELVTNPDNTSFVEKLLTKDLRGELSKAALEVLSIIAYRGPISKTEIEAIRGVNCSFTVRNLLMRGLIDREDNPNDSRGYLYSISFQFLKELGLKEVTKLPDYDKLSVDERINSVLGS